LRDGSDEASLQRAIASAYRDNPGGVWEILSLIDQYYRRGRIPGDTFNALRHWTEKLALGVPVAADGGETSPARTMRLVAASPAIPTRVSRTISTGTVLRDRYEIRELLGQGGIGQVFAACDRFRSDLSAKEQRVAIKLLRDTKRDAAEARAALRNEFHCAQLLSHPNIIRVYDIDRDGDQDFFTMELLGGVTLDRLLRDLPVRRMPAGHALAVIRQIGSAVSHAHARHVIHGDLKPHNVMIDVDGSVRVFDFGVASKWQREPWIADPAQSNNAALTPRYASCELLEGQYAEPRDDLYALGCIAYELLAGEHPYQGQLATEARRMGLRPRRPSGLATPRWRALRSAVALTREQRPASVDQWLEQMELAAFRAPPPLATLTAMAAGGTGERSARRWRAGDLLAMLLVAAAIAAGTALWMQRPATTGIATAGAATADDVNVAAATALRAPVASDATSDAADAPAEQPTPPATVPGIARIQLAAEQLAVGSGAAAARLVIRRSGDLREAAQFRWWTEPGSARPGDDYVEIEPRTEQFAAGEDAVTVFVPLVIDPVRTRDVDFAVVIADPSTGAMLGPVTRTTVRLTRAGST